ncbi:hypothetical protein ROG8370_03122 [Roseovarius gaetbuli]|uniref:Glycosyl transferase family 2 n=1 Tax=Roseovarius gaetbuli TaxID=1356575 RepID=A0A1X7A0K5_9RHOB|nr:glycosyltransferase family 2 protein [Roseovarius gaetbuli]SLN66734.1 hypothetical protein ROG8370_03122 [Roseovarius gaetbuli]
MTGAPKFPIAPVGGGPRIIMTTMKNEAPFMLEWIAHNLSIGFSGFVIFTNDCVDGTDLMAQRLDELGFCSHRPNPKDGSPPQHKALRRSALHPWVQQAEWLMSLDVDEFINLRGGLETLDDLMERVGDCDAISFTWKLFGCGGVETYEDAPVTRQFLLADHEDRPSNGRASGFKTMFRNNGTFSHFGPHRPKGVPPEEQHKVRWSDCGGNRQPMEMVRWRAWPGFSHEYARLHHYSVRSIDSFLVKRDRGRTNHIAHDQSELYWADMNVNHARDDSILPHADRAQPMLQALLEDPVLADLHARACDWHRAKIDELQARPDWTDFRRWLRDNKLGVGPRVAPD